MRNSWPAGDRQGTMSGTDIVIPFGITICGIPELDGHSEAGASHVLSILDPEWPVPAAFESFGAHRRLELRFHDVIEDGIPGMEPPREEHVVALLAFGRDAIAAASHLVVHCHAGVSRSTASVALILAQALPQLPGVVIFREVLRIRPQAWPNLRIVEMGDRLLDRGGDLLAGAREIYSGATALTPRPGRTDARRRPWPRGCRGWLSGAIERKKLRLLFEKSSRKTFIRFGRRRLWRWSGESHAG